jgi:hypothetical protein
MVNKEQYLKADAEGKMKILAKEYGVPAHQFWKHQQSGKWIINHAGVQTIAAQEGVIVEYEVIAAAESFAVIKADIKDGQSTFGEASKANCKMPYPVAMAEKRAFDRAILIHILRHVGGYGADFYAEDEADDFKQPAAQKKATADKKGDSLSIDDKKRMVIEALESASGENQIKSINAKGKAIDDSDVWLSELDKHVMAAKNRLAG